MEASNNAPDDPIAPLRVTHVELDGWEPLGGPVSFDLAPRCTVLLGKNGAGKSLVCEALQAALSAIVGLGAVDKTPLLVNLDVQTAQGERIQLQRRMRRPRPVELRGRLVFSNVVLAQPGLHVESETCRTVDGTLLWRVGEDELKEPPLGNRPWMGNSAVQHFAAAQGPSRRRDLAQAIQRACNSLQIVPPGVLRDRQPRQPLVLSQEGVWFTHRDHSNRRLGELASILANAPRFVSAFSLEEFQELGQTLGVWKTVEVVTYQASASHPAATGQDLARVFFDGVDIGLLADGTLRLARILCALLSSSQTIFIEEPELGIHPGLLWKLLEIVDSYSAGKQLILSTHSPQVVSWAKPEELRLVERRDGKTGVRSLSELELSNVHAYLSDGQGTLGDYAFSGGLDGLKTVAGDDG